MCLPTSMGSIFHMKHLFGHMVLDQMCFCFRSLIVSSFGHVSFIYPSLGLNINLSGKSPNIAVFTLYISARNNKSRIGCMRVRILPLHLSPFFLRKYDASVPRKSSTDSPAN
ncbi:unnamed protein product [Ilex paraguariensis]|uniref:Uncharacterized protein n=1 Tax=Ilex paraguariensis TaxID=185542 RepID=A0ABC8QWI5_9AQUA